MKRITALAALLLALTAGIAEAQTGFSGVLFGTFTRQNNTTAYSSGQVACPGSTAGACVPMSIPFNWHDYAAAPLAIGARLVTSSTSITTASFRLHIYRTLPTASNADGSAWLTDQAQNEVACFDVTLDKAYTDGAAGTGAPCGGAAALVAVPIVGSPLYGFTEVRSAYTPTANEVFSWYISISTLVPTQ